MTSSPRETELCRYHYDPLDRLISHALADTPGRQRFYCKSRLTTEVQGAMRYSIVQHGDQLLAQHRSEGDEPDTTLLATDQQRSVLQAVTADHLPQPIAYSPYGHGSVESGLLSLLGFNGERPDLVTGHYLLGNGYRAFNPVLMRFNSPDSWSPFGKGGLNAYAYGLGNPVNSRDPTGHISIENIVSAFQRNIPSSIPRATTSTKITTAITAAPEGYKLAGFHGSSSKHIKSFEEGVNQKYARHQRLGKGFYATPDIDSAADYARTTEFGNHSNRMQFNELFPYHDLSSNLSTANTSHVLSASSATVYGVYVKNYDVMTPGENFTFSPNRLSIDTPTPFRGSVLVFPPEMHRDIIVRPLDSLKNLPTPYTDNLNIRSK